MVKKTKPTSQHARTIYFATSIVALLLVCAYVYLNYYDPRAKNSDSFSSSRNLQDISSHVFVGRVLKKIGEENLPEKECQYEVEMTANPLQITLKGDVPDRVIISSANCFQVDIGKIPAQHDGKSGTVFYTKYNYKHDWYSIIGGETFAI